MLSMPISAWNTKSMLEVSSYQSIPFILAASPLHRCYDGLQGLAAAAATREAAKRKGHSAEDQGQLKRARKVPVISHEVALPKGYEVKDLKEELYGVVLCLLSRFPSGTFGEPSPVFMDDLHHAM